jgi:hypothetical protein
VATKPLTYRDFNIEMTDLQADGAVRVRVVGAVPGGEMPPAGAESATFRAEEFTRLLGKLERRKLTKEELFDLGRTVGRPSAARPGTAPVRGQPQGSGGGPGVAAARRAATPGRPPLGVHVRPADRRGEGSQ